MAVLAMDSFTEVNVKALVDLRHNPNLRSSTGLYLQGNLGIGGSPSVGLSTLYAFIERSFPPVPYGQEVFFGFDLNYATSTNFPGYTIVGIGMSDSKQYTFTGVHGSSGFTTATALAGLLCLKLESTTAIAVLMLPPGNALVSTTPATRLGTLSTAIDTTYRIEIGIKPSSTAGASDGRVRVWQDSVLVVDYTGVVERPFRAGTPNPAAQDYGVANDIGKIGLSGHNTSANYVRFANLVVWTPTGAAPNTAPLGPMRVNVARPSTAALAEVIPDFDTSSVITTNVASLDVPLVIPAYTGTVVAAQAVSVAKSVDLISRKAKTQLRKSGVSISERETTFQTSVWRGSETPPVPIVAADLANLAIRLEGPVT